VNVVTVTAADISPFHYLIC